MTLHLVIDCESTGIFNYDLPADAPGQPRVCQIGMIWVRDDLTEIASAERLIKPDGWTIGPEATAVNGLTQEMLEEAGEPIDRALTSYVDAIKQKHIIVGYNVAFDVKLMRGELRRAKLPDYFMATRTLDVMNGCRRMVDARTKEGKKKPPSLEEACRHFDVELEPTPHRALGGARATLHILRKMREQAQMPAYKDPYDRKAR